MKQYFLVSFENLWVALSFKSDEQLIRPNYLQKNYTVNSRTLFTPKTAGGGTWYVVEERRSARLLNGANKYPGRTIGKVADCCLDIISRRIVESRIV
jgi:hypothetical protein